MVAGSELGIPNERPRVGVILLVPMCNYIKNEKHYGKYKAPHWLSKPSDQGASGISASTVMVMPQFTHPRDIREKNGKCKLGCKEDFRIGTLMTMEPAQQAI